MILRRGHPHNNLMLPCGQGEFKGDGHLHPLIMRLLLNKKAGYQITDKGAKRLNPKGNQANHRINGQTPSKTIKPKRRKKRKKKG